ncbi:hypothetical protein L596_016585 [Steinernema carpocapsae]|uniref:Tyrosine-protein phosphatase domain-containing protein n=1 Tax=Steinernema carpocapsae TaxID=34508 RepID=A0A4U5NJ93_STECR|nr:hypothetical protein L596_016585 [Steinernema carpocapsae]
MVYHEEPMAIVVVLHKDEMCDDSGKKAPFFWPTNVGDSKTYHSLFYSPFMKLEHHCHSGHEKRGQIGLRRALRHHSLGVRRALQQNSRTRTRRAPSGNTSSSTTQVGPKEATTDPTDLANFIKRKVLNSLGRPQDNDTPTNPLLIVSLNGLNRAPAICGLVEVAWSCELKTHRFDLVALAEKLSNQRPGAITDVHSYLTFFATSFRLASLYSMGNAQELDAVVKNLMKPLPSDVLGKVTKTQGSLEETAEEDSMDHFDKEASSKSKKKSFIESVDVPL